MDVKKANQILRIAKMYYEQHLPQQEIAKIEELSKSTVSRLLKKAQDLGYIKVEVVKPYFSTADLESRLRKLYDLKQVTVVPNFLNNKDALIRDISTFLLKDLKKLVKDGDTISLSWGNSMLNLAETADSFEKINRENIKIVQLCGGASAILRPKDPSKIARSLGNLFNAESYQICAPTYVQRKETADFLKEEEQIRGVLDLARKSSIAIFSAGIMKKNKLLFELGCLSKEDQKKLDKAEAVGDICTHFLDHNGEIARKDIDDRSISLTLEEIRVIPEKIFIVSGKEKAPIVKIVLENKLADRIYMDEDLAKAVVKS